MVQASEVLIDQKAMIFRKVMDAAAERMARALEEQARLRAELQRLDNEWEAVQ